MLQAEGAATTCSPLLQHRRSKSNHQSICVHRDVTWDIMGSILGSRLQRRTPARPSSSQPHRQASSSQVNLITSTLAPHHRCLTPEELAELFSDENSKSSLSREDVYSGFRALATSNIRNSRSKQQLGNLHFRLFLYRVFDVQSAIDRGGANPTIARVVASDLDLLDRQTGSTPQAKIDDAGSGGTPLASSDELQPLLRTMTTTPKTVSDFRGECLLAVGRGHEGADSALFLGFV